MRIRTGSSLAVIISFCLAKPVLAAPLQPIDKWAVDYGATQCTAARSFGDASNPITFGVVPSLSGTSYVLQVSEPESGPRFAQEVEGNVDFGKGPIKRSALFFGGNGVKLRAHQFRLRAAEMEQASSATSVKLRGANGEQFEFALADMPAALDALRKCNVDLQQSWNVGGSLRKPQAPLGNIADIFVTNDLPRESMEKHRRDSAQYELLVDEKGAIAGCDVVVSSSSALIDTIGCQLVTERARFNAATDTSGKAVRSVWTSPPVTWRTNQEAFDTGCRVMNGSGSDLNSCGQTPGQNIKTEAMSAAPQ